MNSGAKEHLPPPQVWQSFPPGTADPLAALSPAPAPHLWEFKQLVHMTEMGRGLEPEAPARQKLGHTDQGFVKLSLEMSFSLTHAEFRKDPVC